MIIPFEMSQVGQVGITRWVVKGTLFWIVFMILYFAYKLIPCAPLGIICATTESNFQHYKAAYFSWIILSAIEYGVYRRMILARSSFIYSRIATASLLPWFIFLFWYLGPAVYGRMPSIPLEILYANIITVAVGFCGAIFEQGMLRISYPRELKTVILLLAVSSLLLYMVFTFDRLPWADVFIEPDWR